MNTLLQKKLFTEFDFLNSGIFGNTESGNNDDIFFEEEYETTNDCEGFDFPEPDEYTIGVSSEMEEISINMHVGDIYSSGTEYILRNQFTHVVHTAENNFLRGRKTEEILEEKRRKEVKEIVFPLFDVDTQNLAIHFDRLFSFLDEAYKNKNAKVNIRCYAGISRSSSMAIAYLMYRFKYTFDEALKKVKNSRFICNPNRCFKQQLRLFEKCNYDHQNPEFQKSCRILCEKNLNKHRGRFGK